MQGRVHPDADRQLRGRPDAPPLRHDRHRVPLLECVSLSAPSPLPVTDDDTTAIACADAYLSSVNSKKQAQLSLEHQQEHTLADEKKIAAVA